MYYVIDILKAFLGIFKFKMVNTFVRLLKLFLKIRFGCIFRVFLYFNFDHFDPSPQNKPLDWSIWELQ